MEEEEEEEEEKDVIPGLKKQTEGKILIPDMEIMFAADY